MIGHKKIYKFLYQRFIDMICSFRLHHEKCCKKSKIQFPHPTVYIYIYIYIYNFHFFDLLFAPMFISTNYHISHN